jgi:hypothetical protein
MVLVRPGGVNQEATRTLTVLLFSLFVISTHVSCKGMRTDASCHFFILFGLFVSLTFVFCILRMRN